MAYAKREQGATMGESIRYEIIRRAAAEIERMSEAIINREMQAAGLTDEEKENEADYIWETVLETMENPFI